ncbi:hypothetical protein HF888_03535 [Bermanella marisrubri]|uniref:Formyltetrahydrofolate deformylase n=1 Tax=Bermanella marisrubri TaxID=207949 RepID=Q1N0B9_9GAMM|nr:TonB C-terminal domain-containing protein [Bermanella marisrubri]EAT11598.1 formyltetrahydrofolate deformylase [Oceanobacter sp. RED65] [Bermanella marisrubri]QIZ83357.1 hypothetical protein HF888_03535 [Bermanella marisrubri]
MNRALITTIAVSFAIHVLLYWLFMADLSVFFNTPAQTEQDRRIEIALQPRMVQEKDQPPPPQHLEDDLNKANNQDGTLETATKAASSAASSNLTQEEPEPKSTRSIEQVIAAAKRGQKIESLDSSQEQSRSEQVDLQSQGLESLSDQDLADNRVDSPLNSNEEEKARWFNEVLKRITEQVNYVWVKPNNIDPSAWGIIRMDINSEGYLRSAWVHLPSGDAHLDQSALRAIRSVMRYHIPQNPRLSRYYRHLEFRYSGKGG